MRYALKTFAPVPVHGSVFGSFSRDEAGPESDIDILRIAPGGESPAGWEQRVDELRTAVTSWTGNGADILVFTEGRLSELIDADEPVIESWRRDNTHLVGARLGTLLRRADVA